MPYDAVVPIGAFKLMNTVGATVGEYEDAHWYSLTKLRL